MKKSILLLTVVAMACLNGAGCSRPMQEAETQKAIAIDLENWVGESVVVQFRRDALGAAAALPINPNTGSFNGAETMIAGMLVEMNSNSVTIKAGGRLNWVPREVILLIEKRS